MKIRPVGAELLHADRWTDGHDEANSRFSQFCEQAQKYITRKGVAQFPNICYEYHVRTLSQESLRSLPRWLHCYHRKQNVRKYV